MSLTLSGTFVSAMPSAAAAAAAVIPAAAVLGVDEVLDGVEYDESLLPGPGARALVAKLEGETTGTIVFAVSAELAVAVESGPLGDQDLSAGLEASLAAAVDVLAERSGEGVRAVAPQVLDAQVALDAGPGFVITAVPLSEAGVHLATLAVVLEAEVPVAPAPTAEGPLAGGAPADRRPLELLADVEMGVTAELGRTRMNVRDLLALAPGAVVELDRAAGSPVDLLVNGTLIARGEVVVIDEEYGVRISEIVAGPEKGRR